MQHASLQQHVGQLQHRLRVLETAEALLQAANTRYLSDLSPRLKPRIEQHLPVLTLGRYTQADLGDDLSLQVYHPERAEMLPVREDSIVWSAGVLDQLFLPADWDWRTHWRTTCACHCCWTSRLFTQTRSATMQHWSC